MCVFIRDGEIFGDRFLAFNSKFFSFFHEHLLHHFLSVVSLSDAHTRTRTPFLFGVFILACSQSAISIKSCLSLLRIHHQSFTLCVCLCVCCLSLQTPSPSLAKHVAAPSCVSFLFVSAVLFFSLSRSGSLSFSRLHI